MNYEENIHQNRWYVHPLLIILSFFFSIFVSFVFLNEKRKLIIINKEDIIINSSVHVLAVSVVVVVPTIVSSIFTTMRDLLMSSRLRDSSPNGKKSCGMVLNRYFYSLYLKIYVNVQF